MILASVVATMSIDLRAAAPPSRDQKQRLRFGVTRLTAAMVIFAIVLNAWFGAMLLRLRLDSREAVRAELDNQDTALANQIANRLAIVDLSLREAARMLHDQGSGAFTAAMLQALRSEHAETGRYANGLFVADAQGAIVVDEGAAGPRIANVADRDFFIAQAGTQQPASDAAWIGAAPPFISKVIPNPDGSGLCIAVSRRLSRPDGAFDGVVFATIAISTLDRDLRALKLGQHGVAALVRGDGTVLTRRPPAAGLINSSFRHSHMFDTPRASHGDFEARSSSDGVVRLFVFARVPGTDLMLSSGESLVDVYASWRARAQMLVAVEAFLTLCIAGLVVMSDRDARRGRLGQLASEHNESLFRGALNGSAIGTALVQTDRRVSYVNPALGGFLGAPSETLLGERLHGMLGLENWAEDQAGLVRLERGGLEVYTAERAFTRSDGTVVHGLMSVTLARGARGARFFIVQIQDTTQRVVVERALSEQNERLLVTLTSIADGVVATDPQGRVRFVNPAAAAISGWSNDAAQGLPISTIFSLREPETDAPLENVVRRALAAPRATHISVGGVMRDRAGTHREVACSAAAVRAVNGQVLGAVLVLRDVSESRELHRRLAYNASHDALTGLPNRTAFGEALEIALADVRDNGRLHALAFIDLDRFKIVNDTAGHGAGDALLKQIASLVPAQLRGSDVVGRLGGDEIGVILRDCSIDAAKLLLERLNAAIRSLQFIWEGRHYSVSASIGLTAIEANAASPNALLTQADVACYAAKNGGRNGVSVYSGAQSEAADWHREILLAAGIDEAIEEGRMFLYAQKVLPNGPEDAVRWELLARMFDRDGSPIPTSIFIPAAERYDMMARVDRWVLALALSELRRALDLGLLIPVHINLSANSLNDATFVPEALRQIADSGVPPTALTFEITETALMRNLAAATVAINSLRAVGIEVALDDFGIGLSSFGYLRHFPVDLVKIDGGFIVNMTENAVDRNIVKSIQQITRDLGARTVAESVEDEPTLLLLRQMGVDFFQGYGIHRPEPLRAVIDRELGMRKAPETAL